MIDHIVRDPPPFFEGGSHHSAHSVQEGSALQQYVVVDWDLHGACSVDDALNGPVEELACRRRATVGRDAL